MSNKQTYASCLIFTNVFLFKCTIVNAGVGGLRRHPCPFPAWNTIYILKIFPSDSLPLSLQSWRIIFSRAISLEKWKLLKGTSLKHLRKCIGRGKALTSLLCARELANLSTVQSWLPGVFISPPHAWFIWAHSWYYHGMVPLARVHSNLRRHDRGFS